MVIPEVDKRFKAVIQTIESIPDLKVIKPKVFPGDRGYFSETFNVVVWADLLNFKEDFKQDNHSFSRFGVLRGLHTQPGMGKLVSVPISSRFRVRSSTLLWILDPAAPPTYGQWHGVILNGKNKHAFWIPDGFLHGFQCLSPEGAHVTYKCTGVYDPKSEYGTNPFDTDINVAWPITEKEKIVVSERDTQHKDLKDLQQ